MAVVLVEVYSTERSAKVIKIPKKDVKQGALDKIKPEPRNKYWIRIKGGWFVGVVETRRQVKVTPRVVMLLPLVRGLR